ncbi:MAG: hypothetical protein HC797_10015, partial [Anaerolineales bacterium]|nr:hypothetical protein [Anaerolineales bacterium]
MLSLACSSLAELSPTATPMPTATSTPRPIPTNTSTPAGPVSNTGNPIIVSAGDLSLSNELYEHPSGLLSFYPITGWKIEASDYFVSMIDPNTGVGYYITITNTGYKLDKDAFTAFRTNMEGYYTFRNGYQEISNNTNDSINLHVIEKIYDQEGIEVYASSIYQQYDNIIYDIEMIGGTEFAQTNSPHIIMFNSFTQTITIDNEIASDLPLYQYSWTYQPQDINASLVVPYAWSYQVDESTSAESVYFFSPDNNAVTQFVIFKNTPKYNQQQGFDSAMVWLNSAHSNNANDIQPGDISEIQPGLYLFGWSSQSGETVGAMTYDVRIP